MDFREGRDAGLVYVLDFVTQESDRTGSCDVLFLFRHVITLSNNGKSVLLSRKGQQPESIDSPLATYIPHTFWGSANYEFSLELFLKGTLQC